MNETSITLELFFSKLPATFLHQEVKRQFLDFE